jgi:hypothetical protein
MPTASLFAWYPPNPTVKAILAQISGIDSPATAAEKFEAV